MFALLWIRIICTTISQLLPPTELPNSLIKRVKGVTLHIVLEGPLEEPSILLTGHPVISFLISKSWTISQCRLWLVLTGVKKTHRRWEEGSKDSYNPWVIPVKNGRVWVVGKGTLKGTLYCLLQDILLGTTFLESHPVTRTRNRSGSDLWSCNSASRIFHSTYNQMWLRYTSISGSVNYNYFLNVKTLKIFQLIYSFQKSSLSPQILPKWST